MASDAIVVGGGVIGCSIAWRLSQFGLKVTLIERGQVGREASWAAAGMLGPHSEARGLDSMFELCLKSREMYPSFAAELKDATGIDPEYRDEGGFFVSTTESDQEYERRFASWQIEAGLGPVRVPVEDVRSSEPEVTSPLLSAIFIPGDHQIENRLLMKALDHVLKQSPVTIIEGQEVTSLVMDSEGIAGVACSGNRYESRQVVLAAGCWSSALARQVGLNVDVTPALGQMLAVVGPSLNHVVHSTDCYLVPRLGGRLLIGATVDYVGYEKKLTAGAIHSLITAATRLVPGVTKAEVVETWSGLRPDTGDHLPIIGPSGIRGLTLATGHFRNGILLAPVTAQLVTETIESGRVPAELAPFSVERFNRSASVS
jgi:glycine oxidase